LIMALISFAICFAFSVVGVPKPVTKLRDATLGVVRAGGLHVHHERSCDQLDDVDRVLPLGEDRVHAQVHDSVVAQVLERTRDPRTRLQSSQ
jgi:hypothetical protein